MFCFRELDEAQKCEAKILRAGNSLGENFPTEREKQKHENVQVLINQR